MVYLKKHLNITYEKGLFIKIILIFAFAIFMYYQRSMILNVISLVVVCIFSISLNKEFLINIYKTILKALRYNK